jgi:hypothetical protein
MSQYSNVRIFGFYYIIGETSVNIFNSYLYNNLPLEIIRNINTFLYKKDTKPIHGVIMKHLIILYDIYFKKIAFTFGMTVEEYKSWLCRMQNDRDFYILNQNDYEGEHDLMQFLTFDIISNVKELFKIQASFSDEMGQVKLRFSLTVATPVVSPPGMSLLSYMKQEEMTLDFLIFYLGLILKNTAYFKRNNNTKYRNKLSFWYTDEQFLYNNLGRMRIIFNILYYIDINNLYIYRKNNILVCKKKLLDIITPYHTKEEISKIDMSIFTSLLSVNY